MRRLRARDDRTLAEKVGDWAEEHKSLLVAAVCSVSIAVGPTFVGFCSMLLRTQLEPSGVITPPSEGAAYYVPGVVVVCVMLWCTRRRKSGGDTTKSALKIRQLEYKLKNSQEKAAEMERLLRMAHSETDILRGQLLQLQSQQQPQPEAPGSQSVERGSEEEEHEMAGENAVTQEASLTAEREGGALEKGGEKVGDAQKQRQQQKSPQLKVATKRRTRKSGTK